MPQLVAKEKEQRGEKTTNTKYSSENGINKKVFLKFDDNIIFTLTDDDFFLLVLLCSRLLSLYSRLK